VADHQCPPIHEDQVLEKFAQVGELMGPRPWPHAWRTLTRSETVHQEQWGSEERQGVCPAIQQAVLPAGQLGGTCDGHRYRSGKNLILVP
jgi:hypothetical protein